MFVLFGRHYGPVMMNGVEDLLLFGVCEDDLERFRNTTIYFRKRAGHSGFWPVLNYGAVLALCLVYCLILVGVQRPAIARTAFFC